MNYIYIFLASLFAATWPVVSSAHEVYVLDNATIQQAMSATSPDPFSAIAGNEGLFIFWGIVSFVVFSTVIAASVFGFFETYLDPYLFALKKYALPVARITVGLCIMSFAYMGNIFGSELALATMFGAATQLVQLILFVLGLLTALGFYTRSTAYVYIALYLYAAAIFGSYVLTYTDFIGAFVFLALLGAGKWSVDESLKVHEWMPKVSARLQPYAFPFLRICFGWGVLYASVYAKYIHSELAYQVVTQYDLTRYFPFDPLFVVLGALIIEFIAGAMVFFGVALRWTLIFLAFWLTLSLIYFQELIWPHGILFGLAIALFLHGYDRYSLEGYFFKKGRHEPVF